MIAWKSQVNQMSKKNVQGLINAFDKFILENHSTAFSYDQKMRKQWAAFKKLVQSDAGDVQAHSKYVNLVKGTGVSEAMRDGLNYDLKKLVNYDAIAPILMQIDRPKLEEIAKKTLNLITKNNKKFF